MPNVARSAALLVALAVLWMLLSGYFKPLLLGLGVASCVGVTWLSVRLRVVDREGFAMEWLLPLLRYLPWLLWQIVLSNIDVARRILARQPAISPTMVTVTPQQRTDLGRVMFANSITLTPGTLSILVDENRILVHALSRSGGEDLLEGAMNRRVAAMEASSLPRVSG